MTGTESRLLNCFMAVFPDLSAEEIPETSMQTTEGWDSMATITLISVVEEEFSVQIAPEDLEHFTSFAGTLSYLENQLEGSAH